MEAYLFFGRFIDNVNVNIKVLSAKHINYVLHQMAISA